MKRILAALAIGSLLAGPAFADGTINSLSAGTALTGPEQLPMFQGSNPAVTTTPNAIENFVGSLIAPNFTQSAISGVYTVNLGLVTTAAGGLASGRLYLAPIYLRGGSYTTISFVVTVAGSSTCEAGIYNQSGTLLQDAGAVTVTSTGVVSGTISQSLNSGFYFLALDCAASAPSVVGVSISSSGAALGATMSGTSVTPMYGLYTAQAAGSLPSSVTISSMTPTGGAVFPVMGIK